MNLQGKHVLINSVCPFCIVYNMSTFHCLVASEFSWNCWLASGLNVASRELVSFRQWVAIVLNQLNLESLE